jgi:hypothetical protein
MPVVVEDGAVATNNRDVPDVKFKLEKSWGRRVVPDSPEETPEVAWNGSKLGLRVSQS